MRRTRPRRSASRRRKGKQVCKITDKRLDELSGLVATKTGFVVINDSTDTDSHKRVFFLDTKCKVVNAVAFSGAGPRDPEDLILSPDGQTLWIADIGDNSFNKDDGTRRDHAQRSGRCRPTASKTARDPPGDLSRRATTTTPRRCC